VNSIWPQIHIEGLLSVPFGPINNIEQTFKHPQAVARGVIAEVQVVITIHFLLQPLSLHLAPARWKDQACGSRSHIQREEDASEQAPTVAFPAY